MWSCYHGWTQVSQDTAEVVPLRCTFFLLDDYASYLWKFFG